MRLVAGIAVISIFTSAPAMAQLTGSVADAGCVNLFADNRAAGGELVALKTHNAGGGPDYHRDWLFDFSAKAGGGKTAGTDVGGSMWSVPDAFRRNTVPPEEEFVVVTFPGGRLAIDSTSVRGMPDSMGVVQVQHVGDSLPVGTDAGIGLVLPGSNAAYTAAISDGRTGNLARFPFGTATGIEVAFAPIAEINSTMPSGNGCTVGGEARDEEANFGLIAGYNVYRLQGLPSRVPTPADFIGSWQYYIPYSSFDLSVADTPGTAGPDLNQDGRPDGDGTSAPNDSLPNDLAGLQNPDGLPYTGDEVLIFQDSATNPDGSPRVSGTGPQLGGGAAYWYAFQPVLFQGSTTLTDYDGLGFSSADDFIGMHAIDTDGDGVAESVDFDLDGVRDFYSPQVVIGQTGLGLTNGGLPLLSAPVFGRANPASAVGRPSLSGRVVGSRVALTLTSGFETTSVVGYDIRRIARDGAPGAVINTSVIEARGAEGATYGLTDTLQGAARLSRGASISYEVDVILQGGASLAFGPFSVDAAAPSTRRTR